MGEIVGTEHVGVADEMKFSGVVRLEKRQKESADGVIVEVGGDEADAERPGMGVGRRVSGVGFFRERLGVDEGPLFVFVEDCLGIVAVVKIEGVNERAVRDRVMRVGGDGG